MEAETTWVPSKNVADFTQVRVKISLLRNTASDIIIITLW